MADREHLPRDDEGAAVERAARLEQENAELRDRVKDLERAAHAVRPPSPEPGGARVVLGVLGLVVSAAVAMMTLARHPAPAPIPMPPVVFAPTAVAPDPNPMMTAVPMPPPMETASTARPHVIAGQRLVEVRSRPAGAALFVDRASLGKTPLYVLLPARGTTTMSLHYAATIDTFQVGPDDTLIERDLDAP